MWQLDVEDVQILGAAPHSAPTSPASPHLLPGSQPPSPAPQDPSAASSSNVVSVAVNAIVAPVEARSKERIVPGLSISIGIWQAVSSLMG